MSKLRNFCFAIYLRFITVASAGYLRVPLMMVCPSWSKHVRGIPKGR